MHRHLRRKMAPLRRKRTLITGGADANSLKTDAMARGANQIFAPLPSSMKIYFQYFTVINASLIDMQRWTVAPVRILNKKKRRNGRGMGACTNIERRDNL